jgi:hypothetical protein
MLAGAARRSGEKGISGGEEVT